MEAILTSVQSNPLLPVIIAIFALILAFVFVFPAFLEYFKSINLPQMKMPKKENIVEEVSAISGENTQKNFKLKFNFKSPVIALGFLVAIGVVTVAGYFAYGFFYKSVRSINSWQVKVEYGRQISMLQNGGPTSWPKAKVYLLDVRSKESFTNFHIVGSINLPVNLAIKEQYPLEEVPIFVYSGQFNTEDAKSVADAIVANGKNGKIKYKNPGKIFVVEDGFEGLKKYGLKTESGN